MKSGLGRVDAMGHNPLWNTDHDLGREQGSLVGTDCVPAGLGISMGSYSPRRPYSSQGCIRCRAAGGLTRSSCCQALPLPGVPHVPAGLAEAAHCCPGLDSHHPVFSSTPHCHAGFLSTSPNSLAITRTFCLGSCSRHTPSLLRDWVISSVLHRAPDAPPSCP